MTDARAFPPALLAAAFAVAALLGVAASPGWLAPELGSTVHSGFAWLCHQMPERSPNTHGTPWALCHRCVGIFAGVLSGLLAAPVLSRRVIGVLDRIQPGRLVVAALLPLTVDWGLTALGLWANTPLSRVSTGAVFGLAAGLVLALALRPTFRAHPSPNLLAS